MELEELSKNLLEKFDQKSTYAIMECSKKPEYLNVGVKLSKFVTEYFNFDVKTMEMYADILYDCKEYNESYNVYSKILENKLLSEIESKRIIKLANRCVSHVQDGYIHKCVYNKSSSGVVTFSMTTCKRFDLFCKTMYSFLNCCEDLDKISRWLIVDDNSSEEDRKNMRELFPFVEFYMKKPHEKGHAISMNIIKNTVTTPFLFHMEDDWKFFSRRCYIRDCMEVLFYNKNIKQCLINKNYIETEKDIDVVGGLFRTTPNGSRFYIHEYSPTKIEMDNFLRKYGPCKHSSYWPHWSLRPSLMYTSIFKELGDFNPQAGHFEMEYAHKYTKLGYVSAFLEGLYCIHTGRLTSQINDKSVQNAYVLNNESQFVKPQPPPHQTQNPTPPQSQQQTQQPTQQQTPLQQPLQTPLQQPPQSQSQLNNLQLLKAQSNVPPLGDFNDTQLGHLQYYPQFEKQQVPQDKVLFNTPIYVINLDRRSDRFDKFKLEYKGCLKYTRYSAVDGRALKSSLQLQRLFDGNDYNMRRGMVGCALSHIKLIIEFLNSSNKMMVVLEDDIQFTENFDSKLEILLADCQTYDWDMIYLGCHLRNKNNVNKSEEFRVERMNASESLSYSMGGTFGYVISKNGAMKLLEFINVNGMSNGIDTVQQKAADHMDIYYCTPHLVFSECFRIESTDTMKFDTDIQFDYDYSLSVPSINRLNDLLGVGNYRQIKNPFEFINMCNAGNISENIYCTHNNFKELVDMYVLIKNVNTFIINRDVILCLSTAADNMERLKVDGKFNISSII